VARVKEQGGVTIAQNPDDAEYPDMPRHAIATGAIDFVLPAAEIAQQLLQLREVSRNIWLPTVEGEAVLATHPDQRIEAEQALREVLEVLFFRSGHDFRHYKRATVLRRIERRLQVNALHDLPAYRDFLKANHEETSALLDDMLISVTNFFRDREAFEALERDVIPEIFASFGDGPGPRIWVPACATGEEAYSLAMLLSEHVAETERPETFQVFASDIDEPAISTARTGTYPGSILADVPPARLRRFFSKEGDRFRIAKSVRERVLFALHNVLRDPPFSPIDLISCRNLLIYLDREVQARLLEVFYFALRPGGLLFLGSSESAESGSNLFDVVDKKHRIYRARVSSRGVRYVSMLPTRQFEPGVPPPQAPSPAPRGLSAAEVHQRILEHYAPPSVIVDRDYAIVHMSDHVGRFLQHVGGEPSHHLPTLAHPELRRELRTALFQAVHSGKSVEAGRVRMQRGEGFAYVTMVARPFRDAESGSDFVLVLFDEVEDTLADRGDTQPNSRDEVILRLEEEVERLRQRLQTTIEQSEVSSEELKASNEELQAINEELRSATEELETSKEELQSVNEELITVNSELKSKVEETTKVNDDLQNFMASVDIATVFVDSQLRIKRFTPRAADIFNIIPGDVGRRLLDITHRLDYDKLAEDATAAFENLRQIEREVRGSDGRSYAARVHPYRTGENRIDGAVLTFFDTTSLRRAEEQANVSEDQLRRAAAAAFDHAIIVTDADGLITGWNAGAEAIFGHEAQQALGRHVELIFLPEDVAAGVPRTEMEAADLRGSVTEDRWHRHRDQSRVFCSGSLTVFFDGQHRGYVKIVRDATHRHNAEQAASDRLRNAIERRAEVEASNTLKDDFIAVISHELKNPLNLISVHTEILGREPGVRQAEHAAHAVDSIRGAVRAQTRIIDDLLDMSRIRTGKFTLAAVPVDLNAVVEEIVETAAADSSAASLAIGLAPSPRPAIVNADPSRLEQIVWNLVSNAIKFTPEGGRIAIEVTIEGRFVKLVVSDTGCGIDAYFLNRIFDLFGQAPGRSLRGRSGLGIGLHLVRQLVDRHGGRIRAASEGPGLGSTFTVWLPRYEADAPALEPAPALSGPRLTGLRLLVAEDSLDAAGALKVLLEMEGAQVRLAEDGNAALAALRESPADLVVSDIGMPGLNGYEFVAAMRADPALASIPAVALTGFGRQQDVAEAHAAGFDAHVGKPVVIDELVRQLQSLLARKRGADAQGDG